MNRGRWRPSLIVREGMRNAFNLSGRSLITSAMVVLLGSGCVALEVADWTQLEARIAAETRLGRNIATFATTSEHENISAASCEDLAGHPGVLRAGAFDLAKRVDVATIGPNIALIEASVQLFPDLNDVNVIIGRDLISHEQTVMASIDPDIVAARVGASQPEGIGTDGSLVIARDPSKDTTQSCIVQLDPFIDARPMLPTLTAQLQSTGQINAQLEFTSANDPLAAYRDSLLRHLPLAAGAFCALLAIIQRRYTASETAAYRLSGTSPVQHALIAVCQQLTVAAAFVVAGATTCLVLADSLGTPQTVVVRLVAGGALMIAVSTTGLLFTLRQDPTKLARDR